MDILTKLLFSMAVLFLLAVTLGLLGVVGHVAHWVFDAWSGGNTRHRPGALSAASGTQGETMDVAAHEYDPAFLDERPKTTIEFCCRILDCRVPTRAVDHGPVSCVLAQELTKRRERLR